MTRETKNMPPKKNLSRGCLGNWCDADANVDADVDADADANADADSSKTICRHKYMDLSNGDETLDGALDRLFTMYTH